MIIALAALTVCGSALAVVMTRDEAYLNATSRELAGTPLSLDQARGELGTAGRDVNQIRREMIIEGHEVYAIEGPRTRCILIAGLDQPAGKSESIACQPSSETKALGTDLPLGSDQGRVAPVWTGPSAEAVSAEAGGQRLTIQSGPTILAVTRPDPDAAGTVTWTSAGKPSSFNLIPARDVKAGTRPRTPTPRTPGGDIRALTAWGAGIRQRPSALLLMPRSGSYGSMIVRRSGGTSNLIDRSS